MNKIEFLYDASFCAVLNCGHDTPDGFGLAPVGPLEFFKGAAITRETIVIELHLANWLKSAPRLTKLPLFKALKQLTGFKIVSLGLYAAWEAYFAPPRTTIDTLRKWLDAEQSDKLYAGFEPLLRAICKYLEHTLGNASAMSELIPGEYGLPKSGKRYVKFHPRDHQAAISKAKDDTMTMRDSMPLD